MDDVRPLGEPRAPRPPSREAERVPPRQHVAEPDERSDPALAPVETDLEPGEWQELRALRRAVHAPGDEAQDRGLAIAGGEDRGRERDPADHGETRHGHCGRPRDAEPRSSCADGDDGALERARCLRPHLRDDRQLDRLRAPRLQHDARRDCPHGDSGRGGAGP